MISRDKMLSMQCWYGAGVNLILSIVLILMNPTLNKVLIKKVIRGEEALKLALYMN